MKSLLETQPLGIDAIPKNDCQLLSQYSRVFLNDFCPDVNRQLPGEAIRRGVRVEICAHADEFLPVGKQLRDSVCLFGATA